MSSSRSCRILAFSAVFLSLSCLAGEELVYKNDALEVEFTFPDDWTPILMPQAQPIKNICKDEDGRLVVNDYRQVMGTLLALNNSERGRDVPCVQVRYRVQDVTRYRLRECKDWLEALERYLEENRKSLRITGSPDHRYLNREKWCRMRCLVVEETQKCGESLDREIDTVVYVHLREWGEREVVHVFIAEYPEKATRNELDAFEDIVGSCQFKER